MHRGCGQWRGHALMAVLGSGARHCPSAPAARSAERMHARDAAEEQPRELGKLEIGCQNTRL
jgi:hypothetical protein